MRTPSRFPTLLLLGGLLALASTAAAQGVGDQVIPNTDVDLKVRDVTVERVGPRDVLVVEQIRDTWLWVKTPAGKFGWIKRADVQRAANPGTPAATRAAPTPATPSSPPADAGGGDLLYLVGALGGSHVYTTYGYIGVIADSVPKNTYPDEKIRELMHEIVAMSDNLTAQLQKVREGVLTDEDAQAVDEMIAIYALLREQAQALVAFTESRTPETANEFERTRKIVWPRISRLLGLETAPQPSPSAQEKPQ
jgi:hypothetical protein